MAIVVKVRLGHADEREGFMAIWKRYQYQNLDGLKVGRMNQGVNTQFIVYRIGDTLIDSGPSNQWKYVKSFVQASPVSQLLLTHHHEDHSGNAARIAELCGLTPKAPELGRPKLASGYKTPVLQRIVWGAMLPVETQALSDVEYLSDGTKVECIHTPGHAKDLTCFLMPEKGYFFSGDLYIAPKLKLLRADENLKQLVSSIETVLEKDFDTIFCPHAGVIENGKEALGRKRDAILALAEQARALHEKGMDVSDVVKALLGPEDITAKLTRGNFSRRNLIEQCLTLD